MTGSDPEDPGDFAPHGDGDDGAGEEQESENGPETDTGDLRLPPVLDLCVSLCTVEAVCTVDGMRIDRRGVDPGPLPLCGLRHRSEL